MDEENKNKAIKADMQVVKSYLGLVSAPVAGKQYWVDPNGLE